VLTVVTMMTFRAVTRGWQTSTEYVDRLQHTDYAIDQVISALKCAYYPTAGEQSYDYGFVLLDHGDGESERDSDTIEWSKLGTAIVGTKSSVGDTVHRIQLQILEEGDNDWEYPIERTGLYARVKPNAKTIELKTGASESLDFANQELYQPILVADGVVGFNCRVLKEEPESASQKGDLDVSKFEDEYDTSNSVPYMVQLTFYVEKEDATFLSQTKRMPIVRIIKLPIHQQSKDGNALPGAGANNGGTKSGSKGGSATGGKGGAGGNAQGGGGAPGGGAPGGGR